MTAASIRAISIPGRRMMGISMLYNNPLWLNGIRLNATMATTVSEKSNETVRPKTGILMLNMGGPRTVEEVGDFLHRLFADKDLIPIWGWVGRLVAKSRTRSIEKKYAEIGGGSPIFKWTRKQGDMMCEILDKKSPESAPHKAYVGFRYANPLTEDTLEEMEKDNIERAIAFTQYPQYSCSTTGSSINAVYKFYANRNLSTKMKWSVIDRWGSHPLLVEAFAQLIQTELNAIDPKIRDQVIILFSAHSLPMKAVNRGDPYMAEVAGTVQLVMDKLKHSNPHRLVWQSKVGPLPWLAPNTFKAIENYVKKDKKHFIIVPIAFTSDHIETLHELDIEYGEDAKKLGVETYRRVPALNDHPIFIDALADLVLNHIKNGPRLSKQVLARCPMCSKESCGKCKSWLSSVASE